MAFKILLFTSKAIFLKIIGYWQDLEIYGFLQRLTLIQLIKNNLVPNVQ